MVPERVFVSNGLPPLVYDRIIPTNNEILRLRYYYNAAFRMMSAPTSNLYCGSHFMASNAIRLDKRDS